jgi:hypothetical protein
MSENVGDSGGATHGNSTVEVFMNDLPSKMIHRGSQEVAAVKLLFEVPDTWVIELIQPDGTLQLLSNDGRVTIKGGERFISHVAGGGSS